MSEMILPYSQDQIVYQFLDLDDVEDRLAALLIAGRGDHVLGLVQKDVGKVFGARDVFAINGDHVTRSDLGTKIGADLAVHLDLAGRDQFVGGTARGNAGIGDRLVESDRLIRSHDLPALIALSSDRWFFWGGLGRPFPWFTAFAVWCSHTDSHRELVKGAGHANGDVASSKDVDDDERPFQVHGRVVL